MNYDNTVKFLFTATDNVTRVVSGIRSSISGLTGSTGGGGGLAMASFMGNLGSAAVLGSIQMVTQGVQKLTGAVQEASSAQTQFITTASALGGSLGIPIDKSKALLETVQKDLSLAAAKLPGENRDYLAVLNQLSGTVAKEFKGNVNGFQEAVKDVTIRTAALGSTIPGLTGEASGMTMNRLISGGGGWGELKQLDLLQKSQPLREAIEASAKQEGISMAKWQQASTAQRLKVVQRALKTVATDELFNEFQDTAESLMQSMKSSLFDMQTGLFGFMRRVTSRQDRNALDAFTDVLKRIKNLAAAGNRLAKSLGIAIDPMEGLIDLFDGISNLLGNINYQLDISKPSQALDNVVAYLGEWIGGVFRNAIKGVKSIDSGFLARIWGLIGTFIQNVDWMALGRAIGNALWKLTLAIVRAIPNFLSTAGKIANGLLLVVEGIVIGVIEGIGQSLYNLFVKPIVDFFQRIRQWWDKLKNSIPNLSSLTSTVGTAVNAVTNPVGAAMDLGKSLLNNVLGGDKKGQTTSPQDKVNATNKVTPVAPSKTVQPVSNNQQASNTINGLTIQANSASSPHEIASVVIDELNRRLNFKVSQQLA